MHDHESLWFWAYSCFEALSSGGRRVLVVYGMDGRVWDAKQVGIRNSGASENHPKVFEPF